MRNKKYVLTVTLNPAIDSVLMYSMEGQVCKFRRELRVGAGKGINVSRALKSWGVDTLATGFIGGKHGKILDRLLNKEKIKHRFLAVAQNNRLNVSLILPRQKNIERIFHQSPIITDKEQQAFLLLFEDLIRNAEMVVISGRSVKGLPHSIYAKMIRIAHALKIPAFLDASEHSLKEGLKARPAFIKPNLEEVQHALGISIKTVSDAKRAVHEFKKKGICRIYISMGSKGAIGCNNKDLCYAKAPKTYSINPVGCGDAFVGAVCAGYLQNQDFIQNLKFAVASGSMTASSLIPGDINVSAVHQMAKKIKVQRLTF